MYQKGSMRAFHSRPSGSTQKRAGLTTVIQASGNMLRSLRATAYAMPMRPRTGTGTEARGNRYSEAQLIPRHVGRPLQVEANGNDQNAVRQKPMIPTATR